MCTIINFPIDRVKKTTGFDNLERLFKVCTSIESCNVYLDMAEALGSEDKITERELLTLRRIGRQKRLDLAKPEPKKQDVTSSGTYTYYPELNDQKPDCQMEAQLSYYGKHYFVNTPIQLKGRGITLVKQYTEKDFCNAGDHRIGWYEYQVTKRAFENLKSQYSISMERYLD